MNERFINSRESAGLTRSQVFNLLGIQVNLLREIEEGNLKPIPEDLEKMADCYGVSQGFLLGESPSHVVEALIDHHDAPEHIKLAIIREWSLLENA